MKNNNTVSNRSRNPKISLPTLLAYNATPQASKLVVKYGKTPPTSYKDLQLKLAKIVSEFKGEALRDMALIHPDRNLILASVSGNRMDGINRNDGYYYHNSDGGGTNFRPYMDNPPIGWVQGSDNTPMLEYGNVDVYRAAEGERLAKAKKVLGTGAIILGVVAFGALLVAFGERQRAY